MTEPTTPSSQLDLEFRSDAFAGRRVLVTGGTRGIGAAVAGAFASLGAEVVAAGLNAAETPPATARLVRAVELDVTVESQLDEMMSSLERLDVLVNCAGMIARREEYRMEVFSKVLEVNLTSSMRSCLAARELLARTGGSIVNVASMYSFFGAPHAPAYGASKAGILGLTRSLAVALAPEVRVNAIAPGWIRTDMTSVVRQSPEMSARILDRTPAGRWGETSDVVGTVVFLASRAASFVTGVVVPVDGGYSVA